MVSLSHDGFHRWRRLTHRRAAEARHLNWRLIGALGLNLGLWAGGIWAVVACIRAI